MKRREFMKAAALAAAAPYAAIGQEGAPKHPLVGVQIAPVSIFDEGIERCLDTLLEKASVNALFIYSHFNTVPSDRVRFLTSCFVGVRRPAFANTASTAIRHKVLT
ncbi:MAG: hypothetical protein KDB22_15920 [Planctomycetales bacterium]|nr:hypothetical protein [Planctomycetales bacterium]